MRRALTFLLTGAVGALAVAAFVDALVRHDSRRAEERTATAPVAPAGAAGHPSCRREQLALAFETVGGSQALVLRHVTGGACNLPGLDLEVAVTDRRGRRERLSLGPEAELAGLFAPGVEELVGLSYLPRCRQHGLLRVAAEAGRYSAQTTMPVETCAAERLVRLGHGRRTRSFAIHALDPPTHTFFVSLGLPHRARVAVSMKTPSGSVIRVLDRDRRRRDCVRRGSQDSCVGFYPALQGQQEGTWSVSIRKLSPDAAKVRFRIEFAPAEA